MMTDSNSPTPRTETCPYGSTPSVWCTPAAPQPIPLHECEPGCSCGDQYATAPQPVDTDVPAFDAPGGLAELLPDTEQSDVLSSPPAPVPDEAVRERVARWLCNEHTPTWEHSGPMARDVWRARADELLVVAGGVAAVPQADQMVDRFMSSYLDNVGAFDGSNDEQRDRESVRIGLIDLIAAARAVQPAQPVEEALRHIREMVDRTLAEYPASVQYIATLNAVAVRDALAAGAVHPAQPADDEHGPSRCVPVAEANRVLAEERAALAKRTASLEMSLETSRLRGQERDTLMRQLTELVRVATHTAMNLRGLADHGLPHLDDLLTLADELDAAARRAT